MTNYLLGIDSAWTTKANSGVALIQGYRTPKLVCAGRSYAEFIAALNGLMPNWSKKPESGSDLESVLESLSERSIKPRVIALDLPLATTPITGRRVSDQKVSRKYGGMGAGTHSPNRDRPGKISKEIFTLFEREGYHFAHCDIDDPTSPVFLETYPHPAVIELLKLSYRHPYKVTKTSKYWPDLPSPERWNRVRHKMQLLWKKLNGRIPNLRKNFPDPAVLADALPKGPLYKGYEDALDAVVCAWVGAEFIKGRCKGYGDKVSCIWIPTC